MHREKDLVQSAFDQEYEAFVSLRDDLIRLTKALDEAISQMDARRKFMKEIESLPNRLEEIMKMFSEEEK